MIPDLTGETFNRLKVLNYYGSDKGRRSLWTCECVCNSRLKVSTSDLRLGRVQSCGCYARENLLERITKHGKCGTPEYNSWESMLQRCCNKNHKAYKDYGGRGITICDRWLKDFQNFLDDMGPRLKGYSLERKDVNGGYCPENCIWATRKQQQNNMRNTVYIFYRGKRQCLTKWCEELGLVLKVVQRRHSYYGPNPAILFRK